MNTTPLKTALTLISFLVTFHLCYTQGYSLDFDGADDFISITDIPVYAIGTGDFTVEANVKFDVLGTDGAIVVWKGRVAY